MSDATFDDVLRIASPEADSQAEHGPVRIEEVARLAQVSPITVSRALRRPQMVSAVRRERIMKAVEETGYSSNPHAKALKSGRSDIVAAFVSNILSEQFSLAIEGLSDVLEAAGFQVALGRTSYSYGRETTLIRSLTAIRPAAVFITGVMELESNRTFLRNMGIPIVESWALARDPIDMLVGFSNADGARMVAEHFAAKGYRKVAFIGRSGGRGMLRLNSFTKSCEQLGLKLCRRISRDTVSGIPEGRQAMQDLIGEGSDVDAVFCASDLLAIGALLEARGRGLDVPGDIAIAGFGDSTLAEEIMPGLTTIAADTRKLGAVAGQMLLDRLQETQPEETQAGHAIRNIPLRLIERGST
ncbi:LacI family gluconate utilization system Gnt-I transcriptional repressor [Rhodopseudomonas julia]|uniref:LacI family gluconate utilization system Gnt-I transcriptional repressor n=1 Tax=Rhodopseudomonas julia TaxID=200617 RepID=A0ABU0C8Z0_9BRAD|nr:LacI family DNA-binding transcriptional regulator [Rhodopseudomonas julia]MDQ0326986.1 LacI family gluconate utilization system Gnt-I transcriptional repressor [Rhodopseudomonas julia]